MIEFFVVSFNGVELRSFAINVSPTQDLDGYIYYKKSNMPPLWWTILAESHNKEDAIFSARMASDYGISSVIILLPQLEEKELIRCSLDTLDSMEKTADSYSNNLYPVIQSATTIILLGKILTGTPEHLLKRINILAFQKRLLKKNEADADQKIVSYVQWGIYQESQQLKSLNIEKNTKGVRPCFVNFEFWHDE